MLIVEDLFCPPIGPVRLSVGRGEFVALSGPSGCGKSRFLRAIADLEPTRGLVRLDGRDRNAMSAPQWRRYVRYVAADRVAEDLVRVGLEEGVMDEALPSLSTGQRQRLALLRALEDDPAILLLDEPTAALDDAAAQLVEAMITDRIGGGVGALLVSHDADQLARLAHRALEVRDGGLVEVRR